MIVIMVLVTRKAAYARFVHKVDQMLCPLFSHRRIKRRQVKIDKFTKILHFFTNAIFDFQIDREIETINRENTQSEIDSLNQEIQLNCNADSSNSFFGNRGALFCLAHKGDVAILRLNDLKGLRFFVGCSVHLFNFVPNLFSQIMPEHWLLTHELFISFAKMDHLLNMSVSM